MFCLYACLAAPLLRQKRVSDHPRTGVRLLLAIMGVTGSLEEHSVLFKTEPFLQSQSQATLS